MTHPDDRNRPPGLYNDRPLNPHPERCRQPIDLFVESCAVHSASQGWLPMVKVTIVHVPLIGVGSDAETLELMMAPGNVSDLVDSLTKAAARAVIDAGHGPASAS